MCSQYLANSTIRANDHCDASGSAPVHDTVLLELIIQSTPPRNYAKCIEAPPSTAASALRTTRRSSLNRLIGNPKIFRIPSWATRPRIRSGLERFFRSSPAPTSLPFAVSYIITASVQLENTTTYTKIFRADLRSGNSSKLLLGGLSEAKLGSTDLPNHITPRRDSSQDKRMDLWKAGYHNTKCLFSHTPASTHL